MFTGTDVAPAGIVTDVTGRSKSWPSAVPETKSGIVTANPDGADRSTSNWIVVLFSNTD